MKVKDFDRFAGIGVMPKKESESESDDEDDSDSESSSSIEDEYLNPKAKPKKKVVVEDVPPPKSAKELAADMEKLRIIREKREAQAKARIEADGYDRYAPSDAGGKPRIL